MQGRRIDHWQAQCARTDVTPGLARIGGKVRRRWANGIGERVGRMHLLLLTFAIASEHAEITERLPSGACSGW